MIYEIQGYAVDLSKIVFISPIQYQTVGTNGRYDYGGLFKIYFATDLYITIKGDNFADKEKINQYRISLIQTWGDFKNNTIQL